MTGHVSNRHRAHHHRSHRDDGYRLPDGVRVGTDWMRDAGYFTANIRTFPKEFGFNGTAKTDWNFTYVGKPFDSDRWEDLKGKQPFFAQVNFKGDASQVHLAEEGRSREGRDSAVLSRSSRDARRLGGNTSTPRRSWTAKVGKILKQLEADGLADNTVVVFFADNGQAHVWRGKTVLLRERPDSSRSSCAGRRASPPRSTTRPARSMIGCSCDRPCCRQP